MTDSITDYMTQWLTNTKMISLNTAYQNQETKSIYSTAHHNRPLYIQQVPLFEFGVVPIIELTNLYMFECSAANHFGQFCFRLLQLFCLAWS